MTLTLCFFVAAIHGAATVPPSASAPVAPSGKCPANSTFTECSTMCEPKCGAEIMISCIEICGPAKCQCNAGFKRNTDGACLLAADCPAGGLTCGKNEQVDQCGAACEPQCGQTEPMMCPAICLPPACRCKAGFFRSVDGSCVAQASCPANATTKCLAKCSAGQKCVLQEVQCVRAPCNPVPTCVPDDDTPKCLARCRAGQRCVLQQVIYKRAPCNPVPTCVPENGATGCAAVSCMVGQSCVVGADGTGRCVQQPTDRNCGRNEFFNTCTGCEATCENRQPICNKMCVQPGMCRCSQGFFRGNDGFCITAEQCDLQGASSAPTLSCATVLCHPDSPRCVETPSGPQCVAPNDTSATSATPGSANQQCGKNEFFNGCGGCEDKCGQTGPVACPMICRLEGACRCQSGFFRDPNTNECVTKDQCSESDVPQTSCELVDCRSGMECVMAQQICPAGQKCLQTPTCIPQNISSCKNVKCTAGHHCAMIQVQCFAPPCYPVPQCVSDVAEATDAPPSGITCANVRCAGPCVDTPTGPQCQSEQPPLGPCATMRCRAGFKCIEETVACIMAPCPGQGTHGRCVAVENTEPQITCASTDCAPGYTCHMAEVTCVMAPCAPQPQCVPVNYTNICDFTEVYTECAPNCEETCHGVQTCKSEAAIDMCQPGCRCADKHRRNEHGKCIRNKMCYKSPGCQENEEWNKCFACDKKCGQELDAGCSSDCRSGCTCISGFARNDNGTCIPEVDC
ncbi:unnamed protein product, partial [Mesorhabditis spiculigera]